MTNSFNRQSLGIAVVGAGRIGSMRARLAAQHPAVQFLAISDLKPEAAQALADNLEVTLAIEEAVKSGHAVRLAR